MFGFLRVLDARTAATDAAMRAAGCLVEPTGRWARTYRLDPAVLAERRAAAERERIAEMGRAVMQNFAIAFPEAHADLQQRLADRDASAPAAIAPTLVPAPAVPLDQLAALLAARMGEPDRVVFERLTAERDPSAAPRPPAAPPAGPLALPNA
jgi:hypothetical protein